MSSRRGARALARLPVVEASTANAYFADTKHPFGPGYILQRENPAVDDLVGAFVAIGAETGLQPEALRLIELACAAVYGVLDAQLQKDRGQAGAAQPPPALPRTIINS